MKIKQKILVLASIILSFSASIGFVALGPNTETAMAYKCVGTPDDFYLQDIGGLGDNKAKLPPGTTAESVQFRWDNELGRCVVTFGDLNSSYKSQNDDGSPRGCKDGERSVQKDGVWRCAPEKTYPTNDKPVNDDGSPLDPSQRYCGGEQDNYDEESFSCKESGACNITGTCSYNKVGLNPDPTTNCIGGGGIYDKSKSPTCQFSEDSCKKKDLKLKKDKSGCEKLNECDKKYGTNSQSPEYKACEDAMNNPNKDCDKETNSVLRAACEIGVAAAPESYEGCGEARTVLIKCDENARGVPVLGGILRIFVNVLSVIIGIAAVGGLAWASVQYAKAEDNSSAVTEARTLIRNIIIGLFLYGFLIAIVNWLVPGGIIG